MANTYKVIDEKTWERALHCIHIGKFVDKLQKYLNEF